MLTLKVFENSYSNIYSNTTISPWKSLTIFTLACKWKINSLKLSNSYNGSKIQHFFKRQILTTETFSAPFKLPFKFY